MAATVQTSGTSSNPLQPAAVAKPAQEPVIMGLSRSSFEATYGAGSFERAQAQIQENARIAAAAAAKAQQQPGPPAGSGYVGTSGGTPSPTPSGPSVNEQLLNAWRTGSTINVDPGVYITGNGTFRVEYNHTVKWTSNIGQSNQTSPIYIPLPEADKLGSTVQQQQQVIDANRQAIVGAANDLAKQAPPGTNARIVFYPSEGKLYGDFTPSVKLTESQRIATVLAGQISVNELARRAQNGDQNAINALNVLGYNIKPSESVVGVGPNGSIYVSAYVKSSGSQSSQQGAISSPSQPSVQLPRQSTNQTYSNDYQQQLNNFATSWQRLSATAAQIQTLGGILNVKPTDQPVVAGLKSVGSTLASVPAGIFLLVGSIGAMHYYPDVFQKQVIPTFVKNIQNPTAVWSASYGPTVSLLLSPNPQERAQGIGQIVGLALLFAAPKIIESSPIKIGSVNLPTEEGGTAAAYRAVYLQTGKGFENVHPLVGSSETSPLGIRFGAPRIVDIQGALKSFKNVLAKSGGESAYLPESKLETRVMVNLNVFKKLEFKDPLAEFRKAQTVTTIMSATEKAKSQFVRDFIRESKTINEQGLNRVIDFLKKNRDVSQAYGSFVTRPQLRPDLAARVPGDIDIQLKTANPEAAAKFAQDVLNRLQNAGNKARISPKKPTLIKTQDAAGQWYHAVDIKYGGEPADILNPSRAGGYGFRFGQGSIKIENVPVMKLSEQGLRKGSSILSFQKEGLAPKAHRLKDIGDFYNTQKTLLTGKSADMNAMLEQLQQFYPNVDWSEIINNPNVRILIVATAERGYPSSLGGASVNLGNVGRISPSSILDPNSVAAQMLGEQPASTRIIMSQQSSPAYLRSATSSAYSFRQSVSAMLSQSTSAASSASASISARRSAASRMLSSSIRSAPRYPSGSPGSPSGSPSSGSPSPSPTSPSPYLYYYPSSPSLTRISRISRDLLVGLPAYPMQNITQTIQTALRSIQHAMKNVNQLF